MNKREEYLRLESAAVAAEAACMQARAAANAAQPGIEVLAVGRGGFTVATRFKVSGDGDLEIDGGTVSEEEQRGFLLWVVQTFGRYGSLRDTDLQPIEAVVPVPVVRPAPDEVPF